jgi:hypothetical protein
MKTFATSLVAAAILAAATSSPALAGGTQPNVQLGSGSSCLPNAIRCKRGYRPAHPRCITVAVRQNGTIQKRRVCYYR